MAKMKDADLRDLVAKRRDASFSHVTGETIEPGFTDQTGPASAFAQQLALETVLGSAKLLAQTGTEPEVLRASLEVLTYHGRSDDGSVELALGLLSHKDKKVRKAAEVALQHLLCQPLRGQALEEYWKKNRQQSPTDHAEAGLRRMKLLTVGRARSREAVGQLIGLLDRRQSEVRVCAQRLLTSLTGHDSDARLRGPARNKRHWTNWWRDNQGELELR